MDDYDWNILSDAYDKAESELATLRAENEKLREALSDCEGWIRRYHYEDRPDLADKAKEALK